MEETGDCSSPTSCTGSCRSESCSASCSCRSASCSCRSTDFTAADFNENPNWGLPHYVGVFHKGFKHTNGLVDEVAFKRLIKAFTDRDIKELDKVDADLVNPSAGWSTDVYGDCFKVVDWPSVPPLDGRVMTANMVELYGMSLCRDIPFSDYTSSPRIDYVASGLNMLSAYNGPASGHITGTTIFRGNTKGDLVGPFISQFLFADIPDCCGYKCHQYPCCPPGVNYMTSENQVEACQSGRTMETGQFPERSRYITTLRDLSAAVYRDNLIFHRAAAMMYHANVPLNVQGEEMFIDFGPLDISDALSRVSRLASLACWRVKWSAMMLRPETLAWEWSHRRHLKPHPEFDNNPIVKGLPSLILPQVYPEGAPNYPSYPSLHATIAGACATVLKFFFNCAKEIPLNTSVNGVMADSGFKSTIGGEIDKLASNVGVGRMAAGVNYRFDLWGLELGENVALCALRHMAERYARPVQVEITLRSGKTVSVPD